MLANYLKLKNTILNTTRGLYIWKSSKQTKMATEPFPCLPNPHLHEYLHLIANKVGFMKWMMLKFPGMSSELCGKFEKKGEKRI